MSASTSQDSRRAPGYGRGTAVLSAGIGVTGVVTYAYFSLASLALSDADYGRITLLWSAIFLVVAVLYRPVEQLLSRTIADHAARGIAGSGHLRVAASIQAVLALAFAVAALLLHGPLRDGLFGGSETLYRVLIVAVLAYAASYFARGFLAGHHRFGLYGGLVLMEAVARVLFAVAVVAGVARGQSAVALGMAAAPILSLVVVPWALRRGLRARAGPVTVMARGGRPAGGVTRAEADNEDALPPAGGAPAVQAGDAAARAPADDGPAPAATAEAEFTLARGSGFAAAVLLIMAAEQTLLNAGPLVVKITSDAAGAALAGFVFNVLLIARAPLQLFQSVQTAILPHLTRLRAGGESDPFRRSVNLTLIAIALFSGGVALTMLALGPALMGFFFRDGFAYPRGGLVLVAIGMGLYLAAATLNQAALARGRASAAAACWVAAALGFVTFLLLPGFGDRVLQVEVGFVGAAGVLAALLAALYRTPERPGERM